MFLHFAVVFTQNWNQYPEILGNFAKNNTTLGNIWKSFSQYPIESSLKSHFNFCKPGCEHTWWTSLRILYFFTIKSWNYILQEDKVEGCKSQDQPGITNVENFFCLKFLSNLYHGVKIYQKLSKVHVQDIFNALLSLFIIFSF